MQSRVSSADIADDEDFFDQPVKGQGTSKKAAVEQRSSPCAHGGGHANTSSSSDDSNSEDSSDEKRAPVKENVRATSGPSTKCASVVIQLPPETRQIEQQSDDSKASKEESAERRDSFQEQPARHKSKKKVIGEDEARADRPGRRSHGKKSRMSSYSKDDYSSDEEGRQLEERPSRRSASSASTSHNGQRLGEHRNARSTSAPGKRQQQSRPMTGFGNRSRMDLRALLESLLLIENPRPRRKPAAKPVEFRRRLNYTFSDHRLEMIERENKRLLDKLVAIHYTEPTYDWKPSVPVKPTTYPDVARIKQLEKIQKENLV